MAQLDAFKGFESFFLQNTDEFKVIWDSSAPHRESLPEPWHSQLTQFEKLIFLKAFRSDKLVPAISDWIET